MQEPRDCDVSLWHEKGAEGVQSMVQFHLPGEGSVGTVLWCHELERAESIAILLAVGN